MDYQSPRCKEAAPMSDLLPFHDHLMSLGRRLQGLGQSDRAARLFRQLSRHRTLAADYAEEAHGRLAETALDAENFSKARRHLAAAIARRPEEAHYHHLMAAAVADDEAGNPLRALEHFRRALELDPDNPTYLCDHGRHALDISEVQEGLKSLRRAAELAPDDADVLGQ